VRIVHAPSASELGRAVGREQAAAVGIVDRELARGIRALADSAPERSEGREQA
jgi:ribosomal protein L7Ae-like RNA K-turn-binding protein